MKNIIIILLSLFLFSCNPFISKDLRKKNRANRKLERLTRKFPELLQKDTILAKFDTTIITQDVRVDTIVSNNFDTLEIIKDRFHLKLIKSVDTLIIEGGCDSDTIYVDKVIRVPYDVVKPIKLTAFEQFMNMLGRFWWWGIIIVIGYIIYKIVKKIIKSYSI